MSEGDLYSPLPDGSDEVNSSIRDVVISTDPQRWFILFMFCVVATLQCITWMLLSPIQHEIGVAYGDAFDDSFVAWSLNLGNITYLLFTLPASWIAEKYGRRMSTLLSISLVVIANSMRLIPADTETFKVIILISSALGGIAGPWVNIAGPIISETWFPVR